MEGAFCIVALGVVGIIYFIFVHDSTDECDQCARPGDDAVG